MRHFFFSIICFCCFLLGCEKKNKTQNTLHKYNYKNLILNYTLPNLDINDIQLEKENGDTINLIDINNIFNKLIFCYSEINCQTCIETALKIITEEFPEYKDNIIIISSYDSLRNLYVFKRVNNYQGMIYNDFSGNLIKSFDNENLPALFKIQDNGKVTDFLWVDKSQIGMLIKYLKLKK